MVQTGRHTRLLSPATSAVLSRFESRAGATVSYFMVRFKAQPSANRAASPASKQPKRGERLPGPPSLPAPLRPRPHRCRWVAASPLLHSVSLHLPAPGDSAPLSLHRPTACGCNINPQHPTASQRQVCNKSFPEIFWGSALRTFLSDTLFQLLQGMCTCSNRSPLHFLKCRGTHQSRFLTLYPCQYRSARSIRARQELWDTL